MKKLVLLILTFVLISVQTLLLVTVKAEGNGDSVGPELISVSINKTEFTVGETMVITIKASDDLSGLASGGSVGFYSSIGNICCNKLTAMSDGETLIGEIYLDKDCYRSGTYKLLHISIADNTGNFTNYSCSPINKQVPPEMQLEIEVVNNIKTDWEGPVLQSVTVDKTEANAGDTLNFEATATDPSGVTQVYVSCGNGLNVNLFPIKGFSNILRGSLKIPDDIEDGLYKCDTVEVYDSLHNGRRYNNGYGEQIPAAACFSVRIHGSQTVKGKVRVTDIQYEPKVIKQGEPITFRISLDKGGNTIDKFTLGIQPLVWGKQGICTLFDMEEKEDGIYEVTCTPPVNWPTGEYVLKRLIWWDLDDYGTGVGEYPEWQTIDRYFEYSEISPTFTVTPVFTGTENTSILVGSASFDPLAGVTAVNNTEGDITSKIEVTGTVDTSKAGVYLLKYRIPSTYKHPDYKYRDRQFYYYDFRWVGVSDVMPEALPDGSGTPVAVTEGSLAIGASVNDVIMEKDRGSVDFSNVVTEPGEYTLTNSGDTSPTVSSSVSGLLTTPVGALSISNSLKSTVSAVIDKSGPFIKATWSRNSSGTITVNVSAKDVSGVAELKYEAGEYTLSDCRDNGTAFTGTFTVSGYGKYTIYSRDNFGFESVKVLNINTSSSNNAYLDSIGVSAGKLSPSFSKTKYSYKINLAEDEGSVTLTPVKECDAAVMKINGDVRDSITVDVGNNKTKTVTIKVSYGGKTKAYTFVIKRAKSTNNDLASLTATANGANLPFNEPFSPDNLSYSLTLDEFTKSVKISDTAAPYATSSFRSKTYTLKKGETKVICLTVTAQSGARKTYAITVTRDKSTDNKLKSLKTSSRSFALSPAFSPDTAEYTITMPVNKSTFTLYASPAGYKAAVTIDGIKRTSKKITLQAGQSTEVQVKVTAQSGAENIYHIAVHREISTDTSLKYLKTSSSIFMLSPVFSPDVAEYTITMPASKGTFTLYAGSAGYGSSVAIDDVKRTLKKITLSSGQSVTVHVLVTAQSADTKEYNIIVIRP